MEALKLLFSCQKLVWPCKRCATIDAIDFSSSLCSYHLACLKKTMQQTQPFEDNVLRLQCSAHEAVSLFPKRGQANWLVQCCVWVQVVTPRAGRNCSAFPLNLLALWEHGKAAGVSWFVLNLFLCCQSVPFPKQICSFSSTMSAGKPGPLRHKHQASQERWYFLPV